MHGSTLSDVPGLTLLIGAGPGSAFVALTIASARGVEAEHFGVAGGLTNMTRQVGGAIGLAVLTAVATSHNHAAAHSLTAVNDGFQAALVVAAAIAAVLLAAVVLPGGKRTAPDPRVAPAAAWRPGNARNSSTSRRKASP